MSRKGWLVLVLVAVVAVVAVMAGSHLLNPQPDKLVIVLPPGETVDMAKIQEKYGPVCAGLGKELNMQCELTLSTSYAAVTEALRNGSAQVGKFGGAMFVLARQEVSLRPVAWEILDGQDHYHAYILGRPGIWTEPFTMDQLKGKTVAFVDPQSTTGYIAPLTMMINGGVGLSDLKSHYFATSHPLAVEALFGGAVDVATTGVVKLFKESGRVEGQDYVILAESPPVPSDVWVIGPTVGPALSDRIAAAFFTIPKETFSQGAVNGFVPVDESAYKFIEDMLKTANANK